MQQPFLAMGGDVINGMVVFFKMVGNAACAQCLMGIGWDVTNFMAFLFEHVAQRLWSCGF